MARHWSQVQEAGAVLGLKFMFFVHRWIGWWALKLCSYPVVLYFFLTRKAARQASLDYLNRVKACGGIPENSNLGYLSFKHFLQFTRNLLDRLAAWSGAFNYDNVAFHQRDDFLGLVDKGSGALVIVSHLGNLEICRALLNTSHAVKLNILVHSTEAEKFNRLMKQIDNNNQLNLIQVTEVTPATAILLQEKIDAGEVIATSGDRTPIGGGRQTSAGFLGSPALFPQGPYILASVLRCPVYLMFCLRDRKGYQIFFEAFAEQIRLSRKTRDADVSLWIQKYADRLSHYATRFPLQWNNFYNYWGRQAENSE
ncbi:MAG: hypothetical protein KUG71_02985 [Porticoccaceae bacterium]|nr:hypothetical protein [Porticoccaceae bacterium]